MIQPGIEPLSPGLLVNTYYTNSFITTIEVVSLAKYIDTEARYKPFNKMEDSKECCKYKAGDKY